MSDSQRSRALEVIQHRIEEHTQVTTIPGGSSGLGLQLPRAGQLGPEHCVLSAAPLEGGGRPRHPGAAGALEPGTPAACGEGLPLPGLRADPQRVCQWRPGEKAPDAPPGAVAPDGWPAGGHGSGQRHSVVLAPAGGVGHAGAPGPHQGPEDCMHVPGLPGAGRRRALEVGEQHLPALLRAHGRARGGAHPALGGQRHLQDGLLLLLRLLRQCPGNQLCVGGRHACESPEAGAQRPEIQIHADTRAYPVSPGHPPEGAQLPGHALPAEDHTGHHGAQQAAAQPQTRGQVEDPADLPAEPVRAPAHGDAEELLTPAGLGPGRHGDRLFWASLSRLWGWGPGAGGRRLGWLVQPLLRERMREPRREDPGPAQLSPQLYHSPVFTLEKSAS
ncbi:collagen alpha-1(III) chain-like isoform X3 [Vulpes lagopus]|nr:collagen alpha-1(III) chain-like isoform X3 [Vulpes lagopus]